MPIGWAGACLLSSMRNEPDWSDGSSSPDILALSCTHASAPAPPDAGHLIYVHVTLREDKNGELRVWDIGTCRYSVNYRTFNEIRHCLDGSSRIIKHSTIEDGH